MCPVPRLVVLPGGRHDLPRRHTAGWPVSTAGADPASVAARFASGDPDAVRSLYAEYGGLVFTVAFKVLGNRALADEATQQTFLQAWRAADRFDPDRPLSAWLATIARRVAIDVHRREQRHRSEELDAHESTLTTGPPSADLLSDIWDVREALNELPSQEQELLRLQHFGQLTHAEIAERLEIPLGTVKSRSFRAHRRLAERLSHLGPQEAQP